MKLKSALLTGTIIAGFCLGIVLVQQAHAPKRIPQNQNQNESIITVPYAYPNLVKGGFATRQNWETASTTRFVIVPHHLMAAREMAALFSSFPKTQTIFLIGPDHFSQGKTAFTITEPASVFKFTTGTDSADDQPEPIKTDSLTIQSLLTQVPSLAANNQPFIREHSIYSLLPFLLQTHPQAKIVPILIRLDAKPDDIKSLINAIEKNMKERPNTSLVASIDMSHYLTQEVADFHDQLTKNVIQTFDLDRISKLEIDSPGSLNVVLSLAKRLGYTSTTIHSHTNSLILNKAQLERESTSHIIASFAKSNTSSTQTEKIKTEFWHQLPNIKTTENRLYAGYDDEFVFGDTSLSFFFGVIRKNTVTYIYPFPLDEHGELLTREKREQAIHQNMSKVEEWIKRNIRTNSFEIVY